MKIQTHRAIDGELCGIPVQLEKDGCRIEMKTSDRMRADATGLVHGGFVFGLADYAAMLAVNHPNVVLASADCKFMKPVRSGERLIADAQITESKGKWRTVDVRVTRENTEVFQGRFSCAVLDRHVLDNG